MQGRVAGPRLFRSETVGESLRVYLPVTLLSKAMGLLRGVVLTWLMVKADYGLLSVALAVSNLLNPVCSAGLNDAVQRYVPQYETRGRLRPFLRLAVPLVLSTAVVVSGTLFLVSRPLGTLLFEAFNAEAASASARATTGLTRLAILTALILVLFFLLISMLKGLRMYRAIGLIELSSNSLFAVFAVGLCLVGWKSPLAVTSCYAAAMAVVIGLASMHMPRVIRRIEPTRHDRGTPGTELGAPAMGTRSMVGQMLRFSIWSALAAIMWQILLIYPLLYLQKVAGAKVAAVFVAVQLIAQGMVIVANSTVTVVETAVTKTWEAVGPREADSQLLLAYKATTVLLLGGGVLVVSMAPLVMRILPGNYAEGAQILPLLILFFLLAGHLLFVGVHFHLIERTRHLFLPWLLGVGGHIVFSAWWVKPDGAAASAASWAGVAGMSVALAGALVLALVERRPLDRGSWLLLLAGYGLAAPQPWVGPLMLIVVLALSWWTEVLFTKLQKQVLRQRCGLSILALRKILHGAAS